MIPTNYNKKYGCTVISSACVLWQGDDINCIDLCNGDTLQDVIQKIGTKLCQIDNYLTPITYDLSCFNFGSCPPDNFHDLLQYILNSICLLNNINNVSGNDLDLSQYQVPLASCLQYNDTYGNLITQLPLYDDQHNDYVTLLGSRICSIMTTLASTQTQIDLLTQHVNLIEQTFVNNQIVLPSITLLNGFTDITYTSVVSEWAQLLYRLEQFIVKIAGIYDCVTSSFTAMFSNSSFDTLYNNMAGDNNRLCSTSSLTLSSTKNIIEAFNNIWTYIYDIRNTITDKLCDTCSSCTIINEIKLTYSFVDSQNINFTLVLPTGYDISGQLIYYTIYDNNSIISTTDSSGVVTFSFSESALEIVDYLLVHVNGCIRETATDKTCNYEFTIPIFNPYYGCFKYENVSMTINSITVI